MQTALAYPTPKTALSLWAGAERAAPPSETIVAAVQMFGDVRDEREDGTSLIRFSAARLERDDMRLLLGDDVARAAGVSVIWDEREEQLLQVLDAAPLAPHARPGSRLTPSAANRYAAARKRFATRDPGHAVAA